MADGVGSGVTEAIAETGKAVGTAVKDTGKGFVTGAFHQITGKGPTPEQVKRDDEIGKAQARANLQKLMNAPPPAAKNEGPQVKTHLKPAHLTNKTSTRSTPHIDEASRQAVGKSEQGRNFKG